MAFPSRVAIWSVLFVGCATFRPGPPKQCPLPPNRRLAASVDRLRALPGDYRIIMVDISRDRHHPDVNTGELTLTEPDTSKPYYWETARGLQRGPAPQLIGVLAWHKPMRGYAQDSVIVAYDPSQASTTASLRSGRCLTCWDPKSIGFDVFAVESNAFTGWWAVRSTLPMQYDPTPSKEERKKMVPDPRGYFCAVRKA